MTTEIIIMGCDVHCYREELIDEIWTSPGTLEKEHEDEDWLNLNEAEINVRRNYSLFGLLACVRTDLYADMTPGSKGLPDDVSHNIEHLFKQWDCDAHSESHLTKEELQKFYKDLKIEALLKPKERDVDWVLPQLKEIIDAFPDTDNKHRIVFWFDN